MKILSLLGLLILISFPSWGGLKECQSLTNDKARLACSETLLQAYEAYFVEQSMPFLEPKQTVSEIEKLVAAQVQDDFGMEKAKLAQQNKELMSLSAKVLVVKKNAYGKLTLTLENQQIWKLTEKGLRVKKGDFVFIERGALGSFFIKKSGSSRKYRTKRVQ